MIYFLTCPYQRCTWSLRKAICTLGFPSLCTVDIWGQTTNSLLDAWRAVLCPSRMFSSIPILSGFFRFPQGSLRSFKGWEEALGCSIVLHTYLYNNVGAVLSRWRDGLWAERGWYDMIWFISWDWAWELPYSWHCAPQVPGHDCEMEMDLWEVTRKLLKISVLEQGRPTTSFMLMFWKSTE